jgi:hypothetical protein
MCVQSFKAVVIHRLSASSDPGFWWPKHGLNFYENSYLFIIIVRIYIIWVNISLCTYYLTCNKLKLFCKLATLTRTHVPKSEDTNVQFNNSNIHKMLHFSSLWHKYTQLSIPFPRNVQRSVCVYYYVSQSRKQKFLENKISFSGRFHLRNVEI